MLWEISSQKYFKRFPLTRNVCWTVWRGLGYHHCNPCWLTVGELPIFRRWRQAKSLNLWSSVEQMHKTIPSWFDHRWRTLLVLGTQLNGRCSLWKSGLAVDQDPKEPNRYDDGLLGPWWHISNFSQLAGMRGFDGHPTDGYGIVIPSKTPRKGLSVHP